MAWKIVYGLAVTSRTVVDSIDRVDGPPADVDALQARLGALRIRHAGALIERYGSKLPTIDETAFIAPGAAVIGDVRLGPGTSLWFGCVLRGDVHRIEIGARSNLQDGTVVHLGDADPTLVGEDVVVGHRAVLHGCILGDATLVGIGATILDGAQVGEGSVIGACALVLAGARIPPHSLVLGMPGKVVKTLSAAEAAFHRALAAKYTRLAHNYRFG
jgi:carbonic anhydrase/acetyltransferase-like protein (isoleucine patch superfamily)